jgi:Protein of unknown function (DUF3795)
MTSQNETAYCGIYCPDCLRYKNKYSKHAERLKADLEKISFHKYAEIKAPFGANYEKYQDFIEVIDTLISSQCDKPCRVGGGCSGTPCKIMNCCISKNYEGCWECGELAACDKFEMLHPRCGERPKRNLKLIVKHGIDNWDSLRGKFYIWQ